jgi:ABC-type branched-subunit amino acid transport system ATPase component
LAWAPDWPLAGLSVSPRFCEPPTSCARHLPILIVEHNLDLVLALADRVFALERGSIFHQGPTAALLTDLEYRKGILWL